MKNKVPKSRIIEALALRGVTMKRETVYGRRMWRLGDGKNIQYIGSLAKITEKYRITND